MVNLNIAPESEPSFDIGGQGYLVGEIELRLQIERTAIDEVVAVMECRAVGQCFLTPVDNLISGKSGYAAVEVECHGVVAEDMEIISSLSGELRHRDTTFLAVWLESLEILATERPCIAVASCEYRVEHSEVIAAVAGFAGIVRRTRCRSADCKSSDTKAPECSVFTF